MAAEVIPTDTMQVQTMMEPVVPTQDLIAEALDHRAELVETRIDLNNREINRRAAQNALRPTLNLVGTWGASALAGPPNALLASLGGVATSLLSYPAATGLW